LEEDDPAVHQSLQAATRLGDPTVQVICLYDVDGRIFLDAGGKTPVNLDERPDGETTRALLRRSVGLSHRGLVFWLLELGVKPSGWLRHPLLCRHRLIVLNEDHRWQNDTYELHLWETLALNLIPYNPERPIPRSGPDVPVWEIDSLPEPNPSGNHISGYLSYLT
jgi:hypothetical protein